MVYAGGGGGGGGGGGNSVLLRRLLNNSIVTTKTTITTTIAATMTAMIIKDSAIGDWVDDEEAGEDVGCEEVVGWGVVVEPEGVGVEDPLRGMD